MVVLLLAGRFANWIAPRKLQSLPAAVHAEAVVSPAPEGSSVLSTVIVVFGAFGTMLGPVLSSTTTSVVPLSFFGSVNTATGSLATSKVVLVIETLVADNPPVLPVRTPSVEVLVLTISSLG